MKGLSLFNMNLMEYEQRIVVNDDRYVTINSIINNDSERTFCQCT